MVKSSGDRGQYGRRLWRRITSRKQAFLRKEEVFVSNSLFTAEQLDELLLVYDQIAQREVNLLRRYHYVSAARLLAKLTDRAERVEFYEKWRDLLGMLEFYSINHRLDKSTGRRSTLIVLRAQWQMVICAKISASSTCSVASIESTAKVVCSKARIRARARWCASWQRS